MSTPARLYCLCVLTPLWYTIALLTLCLGACLGRLGEAYRDALQGTDRHWCYVSTARYWLRATPGPVVW